MFKTRLISGIVLVILAIVLILAGGEWLLVSTTVISIIGLFELCRVYKVHYRPLAFIGYAAVLCFYTDLWFSFLPDARILYLSFLILLMCMYVFAYPAYVADQVMAVFFGFFYVAVMLSYVYQLRILEQGQYLAFLIFFCSWGCDTCAYCVGKLFGKHKMTPKLSPKKSVEGAAGGIIGAGILTAIYCFVLRNQMNLATEEILILSLISGAAAFLSMIGDLCASAIKRNYGIKDYGKLIPGHGGILDRFDSMIITAPVIYYLAYFFLVNK